MKDKIEKIERLVKAVADFIISRHQLRAEKIGFYTGIAKELVDARDDLKD